MGVFKPKPYMHDMMASGDLIIREIENWLENAAEAEYRVDDPGESGLAQAVVEFDEDFYRELNRKDDDIYQAVLTLIGGRMEEASFIKDELIERMAESRTKIDLIREFERWSELYVRFLELRHLIEANGGWMVKKK